MSCPTIGAATTAHIGNGVTSVDCQKQVRSWRLLRSLMEFLIPSCNCTTFIEDPHPHPQIKHQTKYSNSYHLPTYYPLHPLYTTTSSSSVITGTIFGYRRGKVSFCIQAANAKAANPILLLEFAVPTAVLAREMQGGTLRIALECTTTNSNSNSNSASGMSCEYSSVLAAGAWIMYCNGRKVGYAVKRRASRADMDALRLMSSVVVGAGLISGKELNHDDELMYLRANFERARSSSDSESFHLIDPDGNIGQELSIFFFRSK